MSRLLRRVLCDINIVIGHHYSHGLLSRPPFFESAGSDARLTRARGVESAAGPFRAKSHEGWRRRPDSSREWRFTDSAQFSMMLAGLAEKIDG